MTCDECGARLPGAATCLEHFHALLAAEWNNAELARMHGLTVLTYHVQHPSRTKPWYQVYGYPVLRRIFGQGEDWWVVLSEGTSRERQERVTRLKATAPTTLPPWVVTRPVAGELTVLAVSADAPAGQAEQVLAWARSVAEARALAEPGMGTATDKVRD
jgi:hypothetical protein